MQLFESTDKIRSFIAIDIPLSLLAKVELLQKELKRGEADVKWVRPEGMHLTLKFLGSISPEEIDRLSKILDDIVPRWASFRMKIKGLGCFPSARNPRVIWMGIQEGGSEALSLQKAIEKAAVDRNFPPEDRPFRPHLTLGRVRSPGNRSSLAALMERHKEDEIGSFLAQEVILFRSELKPSGAVYTRLQVFQMAENEAGAPE